MSSLMCRHCGHFVVAVERDGALVPLRDECPECGGTEFKDVHRGTVVRSDDR